MVHAEDHSAQEVRLAQRAVAGDADAFAELYGRYEKRAYNLCLRILGSEDDAADATQEAFIRVLRRLPKLEGRDLAFGSYVFTSARHACYDLIERRKRAQPSDAIPEGAIPMGGGVGGGGVGFDPGDPEDDPERNVLLDARQEEIRTANLTLPERQREVLFLREVEELSYDEIAEIMGMNRNSVAQLISRARISLRDALRGTALASIATSSAACERALELLAAEQDGEAGEDAGWLSAHVADCETCRLSREAMEEAGLSYRAWIPVAAGPLLFRETMARAAELAGADWDDAIARLERGRGPLGNAAMGGAAVGGAAEPARAAVLPHRKLDLVLMGGLTVLLLLVVFAATVRDGTPVEDPAPVSETTASEPEGEPAGGDGDDSPAKAKKKPQKQAGGERQVSAAPSEPDEKQSEDSDEGGSSTPSTGAGDRSRRSGGGKLQSGSGGGGGDGLAGEDQPVTPPEDPPADRPDDPPADPPEPEDPVDPVDPDPPDSSNPGCRDANGRPVPCPPRQPPGTICPRGGCTGNPPPPPPRRP